MKKLIAFFCCVLCIFVLTACSSKQNWEQKYDYYKSYKHYETVGNASDLQFSNVSIEHNSVYTVCTGKITNTGSRTFTFVKKKGKFSNYSGIVDTDWTYAVGSEGIEPGETVTFRMSVDKDYSITWCDVSVMDFR